MRDQDDRGPYPLLQVPQEVKDLSLDGDVQSRGGLVRYENLGLAGQGYGYDDALAHSAGELVRVLLYALPPRSGCRRGSKSSTARLLARSPDMPRCFFRLSVIWRPTFMVGSSEVMGSWKTIAIFDPLILCICFSLSLSDILPVEEDLTALDDGVGRRVETA